MSWAPLDAGSDDGGDMQRFLVKAGLGICTGLIAAAGFAAPAQASPIDTTFLTDLTGAGIPIADPASTAALGHSICPMLTQPAGTAAKVAAPVTGLNGGPAMSPEMAQLFTEIAVQVYCPQMLSQLASGQLPELPQLPGMSVGVPGLGGGLPGLAGGVPGLAGGVPGLTGGVPGPAGGIPGLPGGIPAIPAIPAIAGR
ncbi:DUF732 domain-containing protein [Mycolicibacter minnesotensis]